MNINIDNNFIKIDGFGGTIYISFMPPSVRNFNKLNLKTDNLKAFVITQCFAVFYTVLHCV